MSNLKNYVQLIGHLGADPEIKTLEKGTMVANIRVATTEHYKNAQGEWQDDTQWHSCALWERLAERAKEYLKKGTFVLIQGKLVYRNYEDSNGVKRYYTEIRVTNFLILDKKSNGNSEIATSTEDSGANDDLPF